MNKISYITLFLLLGVFAYGQVGIENDNPQGILDINLINGKNTMGLVLPVVEKVEIDSVYTSINAEGEESGLRVIPSVTTFDNAFQTINITQATDDGTITETIRVPIDEAPEGTIVYDQSLGCVRYKQSSTLGDWTGCIVDSTAVNEEINYHLYGGQDFRILKGAAGYEFSVAIGADDRAVYTAGRGSSYRTGQGRTGNTSWTNIIGQPAIDVAAGERHGAAVLENGDLYTWGYNYYGQTCQNQRSGYTRTPAKVNMPTTSKVIKVEASSYNTLILTEDGKVYACGRNNYGLNGNGTTSNSGNSELRTPTQITALNGVTITDISTSHRGAAAVTSTGNIYIWGNNSYNRLAHTTTGNITIPVLANRLSPLGKSFKKVSIGGRNGIAVSTDNKVYTWGTRALGSTNYTTPTIATITLDSDEEVVDVEAASRFNYSYPDASAIVVTNKRIYAAGGNYPRSSQYGKLGLVDDTSGSAVTYQNGSFKEIQAHAIVSGAPFTGASIGYNHSIITTGTNTENTAASNLGYGSGRNNYRQQGTASDRRFFMSLKK